MRRALPSAFGALLPLRQWLRKRGAAATSLPVRTTTGRLSADARLLH